MLQRAVVALALLAGGLLLLGGLLAEMENGVRDAADEARQQWFEPSPDTLPPDAEPPPDMELQASRVEQMQFASDVDITIPPGSEVDGETVEFSGPATITLPKGTRLMDLSVQLPTGTRILLGDAPLVSDNRLHLGDGTRIYLPDDSRLVLGDGGRLSEHGLDQEALSDALDRGSLLLQQPARLETPAAVTGNAWQIHVGEGTRLTLARAGSPESGLDEVDPSAQPGRTHAPAGSTLRQPALIGQEEGKHAATGTARENGPKAVGLESQADADHGTLVGVGDLDAPPIWSWIALAATAVTLAGVLGVRRIKARMTRERPAVRMDARIDEREQGLPLCVAPGQEALLHLQIRPRQPQKRRAPTRVEVRLANRRIYHGRIDENGLTLPLDGLEPGDHPIRMRMRTSRFLPARRAEAVVRAAPWTQQVARDYQHLVDTLSRHHPGLPNGATPRQVRGAIHDLAPDVDDDLADRLVAGFEEANYSPRPITAADWLRFARTSRTCHEALARRLKPSPLQTAPERARPRYRVHPARHRRTPG